MFFVCCILFFALISTVAELVISLFLDSIFIPLNLAHIQKSHYRERL